MNEQAPNTQGQPTGPEGERKPVVFAVRIDPVLREQIEGLRGITEQNVNDVGVEALNDWVTKTLADESIRNKAMAEIDAEERRLHERRSAIAGILGDTATAAEVTSEPTSEATSTSRGGRRPKAN